MENISTVVDKFDGASLDTSIWDDLWGDAVTMGGGHLTLTNGTLHTIEDYVTDSAFIRYAPVIDATNTEFYGSYCAFGTIGSPGPSWGFDFQIEPGTAEIRPFWANDGNDFDRGPFIPYDPVNHAYLRVRAQARQIGEDWYWIMICETGPAPGQWSETIRSPELYSPFVSDGQEIRMLADVGSVQLSNFNLGGSVLDMRMPDGSYVTVGTAGQPLFMKMPDGSVRAWPDSGFPLYEKQPDGSYQPVFS